jgi:hypothetical protein
MGAGGLVQPFVTKDGESTEHTPQPNLLCKHINDHM